MENINSLFSNAMPLSDLLPMLAPLVIFQISLAVYCLIQIWRKGVSNLNPWIWSGIVLFVNLLGPLVFLLFGRKKWNDDTEN